MASLNIWCFNPFSLKNKIMKIEHAKIFRGPSKILKNMPKIFHGPHKNPQAPLPTYLMYGPLYIYRSFRLTPSSVKFLLHWRWREPKSSYKYINIYFFNVIYYLTWRIDFTITKVLGLHYLKLGINKLMKCGDIVTRSFNCF